MGSGSVLFPGQRIRPESRKTRRMRKVLIEAEKACRDVLAAVAVLKGKAARVDLNKFTLFLKEAGVLERTTVEEVDVQDEEEEAAAVKERQKSARPKRKAATKSGEGDKPSNGAAARPQREKTTSKKVREAKEEEEDEDEEVREEAAEKSKPQQRKRPQEAAGKGKE
jgi:hypothetical protein